MKTLRRFLSLTIIICMLLSLSGCGVPKYREVEQLLVIETMGLDYANATFRLSLASSADMNGGEPRRLSSTGDSVTAAMERIYDYSYEQELFCYHVGHVLLGEGAAERDVWPCLNYICRSPVMRLDVPLYVVRNAQASELVLNAGDGEKGISEILDTVEAKREGKNGDAVFTAADAIRDLKRRGSTLVCALDYAPSTESSDGGSGHTVAAAGYAVLRDGKLCGYIDAKNAFAADILMGRSGVFTLEVEDGHGGTAALEIDSSHCRISPVFSGGTLTGLNVSIEAAASVLELSGRQKSLDEGYTDALTAALETALSDAVNTVLQSSKALHADFLGLAFASERADPAAWRAMEGSFDEVLPSLSFNISVSGSIRHTNDEYINQNFGGSFYGS